MNQRVKLEEKVFSYMEAYQMLLPGDTVIAGVSGGADSVCLLFMLLEWSRRYHLRLAVVHVHHGMRADADGDAEFVLRLCRDHGLPYHLERVDVRSRAAAEKRSEEEMGRLVRYEAFRKLQRRYGGGKIAVAHNSNDLAETMLFHLFRGSGLPGLCGIRPVRDDIIRPVLCLERKEIEDYLKERGISYCMDITNEGDDYTRNRIRHHILPYADQEIAPGCVPHMFRTAGMLLETEGFLEEQARGAAAGCVTVLENGSRLSVKAFSALHPVIQKRLLFLLLKELTVSRKDIGAVHVQDVLSLFRREGNRGISLPQGIFCRREYDCVILENKAEGKAEGADRAGSITPRTIGPKELEGDGIRADIPGLGVMEFTVFPYEKTKDIPRNEYTKWFDYDKIRKPLVLRNRQTGDYFCIRGSGPEALSRKTVKEYMIGEKIPARERGRILLLAEESHCLWVTGYRISEYYKISENTKRILQVQLRKDCFDSGMEE